MFQCCPLYYGLPDLCAVCKKGAFVELDDNVIICRCEEITAGEVRKAMLTALLILKALKGVPGQVWVYARDGRVKNW